MANAAPFPSLETQNVEVFLLCGGMAVKATETTMQPAARHLTTGLFGKSMIWEVCGEGEAAQRRAQLKPTCAEACQKSVCYLFDAYAVTNSEQPCDDVVMGYDDGIEHVTGPSSELEIRGADRVVSLPTLW